MNPKTPESNQSDYSPGEKQILWGLWLNMVGTVDYGSNLLFQTANSRPMAYAGAVAIGAGVALVWHGVETIIQNEPEQ